MNKKKILITGGAGYVGTELIDQLLKLDLEIICLDLMIYGNKSIETYENNQNIKFIQIDIRNTNNIKKYFKNIDIVIHLAAIVGDKPCEAASSLAFQINFLSTKNIFEISKKSNVKKFIFASTCSNYGVSDPNKFADENSTLNPVSLYAETKIDCENYLKHNSSDNMKTICLRFGTAFGASKRTRFDLTVNSFVYEALKKEKIFIFAPKSWRPYIHVSDMARIVIEIIKKNYEDFDNFNIFNAGFTELNWQKIDIVNFIKNKINTLDFDVVNNIDDPRDYRVSFKKLSNFLALKDPITVRQGIDQIFDLYQKKIITDIDFNNFNLESVIKFFNKKEKELTD